MAIYQLDNELWFPPPSEFEDMDIVALGGDVSPERLLLAYQSGIFPWYNEGEPITWFCPRRRMVLPPGDVKISKSSRNILNRNLFEVHFNRDFRNVIEHCQRVKRAGQEGTWLNDDIKKSMIKLHQQGHAHSVE